MVYTLRQFINECDNYEYSQEYFDIMKESMEIDLMERYIKNQEFLSESVEDTKNKVNEKKLSLITKILSGIRRLFTQFIMSLRKIINAKSFIAELTPIINFIKDLTSNHTQKKYNNFLKFIKEYMNIVNSKHIFIPKKSIYIKMATESYKQTLSALNRHDNEAENNKSSKIDNRISQLIDADALVYYTAIAGSKTSPTVDISNLPDYEGIKICNILTLENIYEKLMKSPEKIDPEKILALLRHETQVSERKGFQMIPSPDLSFEDQQDNIQNKYDKLLLNDPDLAGNLNKLNAALNRIYSNLLSLYSDYHAIKSKLMEAVSTTLGSDNNSNIDEDHVEN